MSPTTIKHNKFTRAFFAPFRFIIKKTSKTLYVKLEYRYVTGHKLHLKNPQRYTEKLQYLRLKKYPKNPDVINCASRVEVRKFLKKQGFEDNLVKIYGVFNKFEDINFATLPESFIMKCTHASGFNYIVRNKNDIKIEELNKLFTKWLKTNYGKKTVELHYSPIKPQIIIEELLLENKHLPIEYKIHVFNGKARYMYIVTDRESDIHYNNYLIDWTPYERAQFNHWTSTTKEIKKPRCWEEAVNIAETISKKFPFVRVDLFIINNHIYISEMTFTPAKGTLTFKDDNVDYEISSWLTL